MNPLNDSKKAVLYVRVSSKEQEKEGFSIQAQYKLLRDYAVNNGFQIAQEFGDVETAKVSGREGFEGLITYFKKNPACKTLLVEKTDRLYRNLKDWVTLDDLGLNIYLVKENTLISPNSRSNEKLIHGIKVVMAKHYIDNLSEEAKKGLKEKAEEGIWPTVAPIGYKNVMGPNGKKIIEIDPPISPLILKLFQEYATGNYSLKEITKEFKNSGLVFRRSKKPLPISSIHRMLRTRTYTGEFDWKGETYNGIHTPIISKDLWDKVQEILDNRHKNKNRKIKHSFPFSGLITCGHCGCLMVGELKKGKYVYYHCTGWKGKCPEPYTREEILEKEFLNNLKALEIDEKVLELIINALKSSHKDEKTFHNEAITRLQGELTRIQGRIDAMYEDKLDGRISQDFFDRKSQEWKKELERILESIHAHQNANHNYLDEGIKLLEMASNAHTTFIEQSQSEKRRLVAGFFEKSSWKEGKLSVKFRQPFELIAVSNSENSNKQALSVSANGLNEKWLGDLDSNQDKQIQNLLSYH